MSVKLISSCSKEVYRKQTIYSSRSSGQRQEKLWRREGKGGRANTLPVVSQLELLALQWHI